MSADRDQPERSSLTLSDEGAGRLFARIKAEPSDEAGGGRGGAVVPGYIIDKQLGEGGSGVVFRAFRAGSDTPVALKLLDRAATRLLNNESSLGEGTSEPAAPMSPVARRGGAARAWRELHILQELRLPCVPRVLDYGTAPDGRLYIVEELVDGLPLDAHAAAHDLSLRARVELLARVADAVQTLHDHAVIHRDVKPSNVLVQRRVAPGGAVDEPVLIDLGLASVMRHAASGSLATTLTEDGRPIGTPAYMAPEQARGDRAAISTRSDVYSLGAAAYVVLTGHTPHDCECSIHEAVRRVATEPARDPRDLGELPRALACVLLKACALRPEQRYESAAAFGADLRRWLRNEPVEAAPPSTWTRAMRWAGRHPVKTTALVCVVMTAVLTSAVVVSVNRAIERAQRRTPDKVVALQDGRVHRLLALNGDVLHAWTAGHIEGQPDNAFVSDMLTRDKSLGGGRVVVTLIPGHRERPDLSGKLCIWDAFNPDEPVWVAPSSLTPPRELEYHDTAYTERGPRIADVFPDLPGLEIIVVHSSHTVPSALRVYNLRGDVLFEAWHVGSIHPIYWFNPEGRPGQIVCIALNNERRFDEWGYDKSIDPRNLNHPIVVFGIEPKLGVRGGCINGSMRLREPIMPPDPAVAPVWYKTFWPMELYSHDLDFGFAELRGGERASDILRIAVNRTLQSGANGGGFHFDIDFDGNIVRRLATDTWIRFPPQGVDWREIDLIDWPIPEGPHSKR